MSTQTEKELSSTKEKVSYCIGMDVGRALASQYAEMDTECLIRGLLCGLGKEEPELKMDEVQMILTNLRNQVEVQRRHQFSKISEDNKKRSEEFLEKNKENEGIHVLSSGLQYKVISSGGVSGARPTPFDTVKVDYRGSFIDGRVFDSSYQRGTPLKTPVNRVLPGWTEILQLMRPGDKWQVFIPHYLAYGEMGFQNVIGPNMALIFEIELISINEP